MPDASTPQWPLHQVNRCWSCLRGYPLIPQPSRNRHTIMAFFARLLTIAERMAQGHTYAVVTGGLPGEVRQDEGTALPHAASRCRGGLHADPGGGEAEEILWGKHLGEVLGRKEGGKAARAFVEA